MRAMNFKSQLTVAFGIALALFLSVGVLSYRRILQESADQAWVEHTHLVLERLDKVELDWISQENNRQSYEPRRMLQQDLSELRRLTSDNPKQKEALNQLESAIDAAAAVAGNSTAGAVSNRNPDINSNASGRVKQLLQNMKDEENQLLARRLEFAALASRRMRVILGVVEILAVALFLVAGLVIHVEIRKRARTEVELRLAEQRYHLLFDSNPLPAWVYDVQTLAILDVNKEAISHYGYPRDEFLRLKITDIRPPEDVSAVAQSVENAPIAPQTSGPWRHKKRSGELIQAEVRSYPLIYGRRQARLVVALDVTERNRAEEALRTSEERFRLLVSGVKDYAILTLDPQGRIASWNEGAQRIKGYRAEEIIGQHFSRFYLTEDVDAGKPEHELRVAAVQGWFEDEGWRLRKDGTRFWANVVITALRDEHGQLRGFGKVTRDMTERRRSEQALQASEERFRNVTETANDAIISADNQGKIVYANRAAEQTFDYAREELIGRALTMLIPERFRIAHLEGFQRFLNTGEAHVIGKTLELSGLRKGGIEFPLQISLSSWETGGETFFTGILSDITERKLAEQEISLRNTQLDAANKELEAFSYSVSHDLRAPLRSIDGFSQALLEDCASKLDATERKHLDRIRSATQRMAILIDDLLNLSRVARIEMRREKINLSGLARLIAEDLQKAQPKRQVEFRIEEGLEAMGDPGLLRLVYENLLGNAWKFTSKRQFAQIEVGRTNHNGTRAYVVRDNGAGFDQAYAAKLFGAFQRLHGMNEFPGTGVGLATVQRIIHRHGGIIWAEGAVDNGASFYFTL